MSRLHRSFGTPFEQDCPIRPGAYIIPVQDEKIAVVRTPKGLFFLGGGIDPGESHADAIRRECMEEAGCTAEVGVFLCSAEAFTTHRGNQPYHPYQYYYLGKISEPVCTATEPDHRLLWLGFEELRGKMFSEMQNWALEMCVNVHQERKRTFD